MSATPIPYADARLSANEDFDYNDNDAEVADGASMTSDDDDGGKKCECKACGPAGFEEDERIHGTHAAHCWEPECEECLLRGPGVEDFEATEMPECQNAYTKGPAFLGQTYFKGHNVICMTAPQDAMQLVLSSIRSGRKFRKLKGNLNRQMEEMQQDMEDYRMQLEVDEGNLRNANKAFKAAGKNSTKDVIAHRNSCLKTIRKTNDEYKRLQEKYAVIVKPLKELHKSWFNVMRQFTDHLDAAFVNSGILKDLDEPVWSSRQYRIDPLGPGETDEVENEEEDMGNGSDTSMNDKEVDPAKRESELHQACRKALQEAIIELDEHHHMYKPGLDKYIQSQTSKRRDVSKEVFANEYGPIHVSEGRKICAKVKAAEDGLAKFQLRALEAGREIDILGYHDDMAAYEAGIQAEIDEDIENSKSMAQIEHWIQTEMDAISLPEAIPDDVPEDSVADVEESIGGGDEAGDVNELEVSDASYLECL
jgi:hypothetical protein